MGEEKLKDSITTNQVSLVRAATQGTGNKAIGNKRQRS